MRAAAQRVEQFAYLTEHVRQRQHRYEALSRIHRQHFHTYLHIIAQRLAVQHHAFRAAGRTAGIVDERQPLCVSGEIDVIRLDRTRVFGLECRFPCFAIGHINAFLDVKRTPIGQRECSLDAFRQLLVLQLIPYIRSYE